MKELVIFDVDNTIVNGQSQKLLLSYMHSKRKVGLLYYLEILPWFILYKMHIINDPKRIMSFAYSFLKGKTETEVDELINSFFTESLQKNIFPEAINQMQLFQRNGGEVLLVSNAPNIIIKRIARYLNISHYLSTELEVNNGVYTGAIVGMLMYGDNKLVAIKKYAKDNGFELERAWAYDDHESDLSILQAVGHPVVVNATSSLQKIANQKHWVSCKWKA
ncbi:MAG: HAD-IB family hydrolase [Patescibacteria group bacterium]